MYSVRTSRRNSYHLTRSGSLYISHVINITSQLSSSFFPDTEITLLYLGHHLEIWRPFSAPANAKKYIYNYIYNRRFTAQIVFSRCHGLCCGVRFSEAMQVAVGVVVPDPTGVVILGAAGCTARLTISIVTQD